MIKSLFNKKKIPVVLITGYLGSGKTTLLNELLQQEKRKIALIVNDMGSVNIDAKILQENKANETDAGVIELSNGCICCTLKDEFMMQIEELSKQKDLDAIFVEASGISDPASIAEGFLAYEEVKKRSSIYLSSVITVVDVDRIYQEFLSDLQQIDESEDADILNLVMDQIEFCNFIVLNKCDLLEKAQLDEVRGIIRKLQPKAEMMECTYGQIDTEKILNGQRFQYDEVMESSTLQRALTREKQGIAEEDECGITSFVFEKKEPFDYDKFMKFIADDYPETIIRAKGYIWFSDDDMHVQLFEQAGRNASVTEMSNWIATFSDKEQQQIFDQYPEVLADWDDKYGDRLNQIVFIGKGYDKEDVLQHLNDCLA